MLKVLALPKEKMLRMKNPTKEEDLPVPFPKKLKNKLRLMTEKGKKPLKLKQKRKEKKPKKRPLPKKKEKDLLLPPLKDPKKPLKNKPGPKTLKTLS